MPMSNIFGNSLTWRLLSLLLVSWNNSGLRRLLQTLAASARQSRTARVLAAVFGCSNTMSAHSGCRRLLSRINVVLWHLGRRLTTALRGSILYRVYRTVFSVGRESKLLGWLFRSGMTGFLLVAVGLYCLIDYFLRDVFAVPVLSSAWDECLMLLTILWIVYRRMFARRPLLSKVTPLDPAVFLFVGIGMALLFAAAPFFSIGVAGYRATVQYMLWFFLVTRLLRNDRDFTLLYVTLVTAAFLIALHGIYQFIIAVPIPDKWVADAEGSVRTRVFSIFGSPNIMGDFMVMFAPMAAGLAYWCRSIRAKLLCWFVVVCMGMSCLFTMSRAAWGAMAVAVLVFALLVDRRLLGLMIVAFLVALCIPFVASRLGFLLTPEFQAANNNGGRGSRWDIALGYLALDPVFGFGLGMFGGAVAMQHQIYKWVSYFYVDNYYLKILVEMGWIGFSCFLFLLAALVFNGIRACYRTSKAPKDLSTLPLCAGMLSGLCGVLFHCYFENIFEEPYMMAYFWTIAAMIVYLGFLRRKPKQTAPTA